MDEAAQALPITIPNLLVWIESQFPVGQSTSRALSVTGEPYVVIGNSLHQPERPGVVEEGLEHEAAFDEETACMGAAAAFRDYAEGKTGTLYWRVKPELLWDTPFGGSRRCIAYMRLLISDKPAKEN